MRRWLSASSATAPVIRADSPAARSTFATTRSVATRCCSTAQAIESWASAIEPRVPLIRRTASTACRVSCCTAPICAPMSAAAWAGRAASPFTSSATTANPRPTSPARAAST